jgi:hypothetical protein
LLIREDETEALLSARRSAASSKATVPPVSRVKWLPYSVSQMAAWRPAAWVPLVTVVLRISQAIIG